MSKASDEVKPALSAEEWADLSVDRRADSISLSTHSGKRYLCVGNNECDTYSGHGADAFPALMALANAALPDNSPHKITHEDVSILRQLVSVIPNGVGLGDDLNGGRNWLRGFAAKLAALLPPETK